MIRSIARKPVLAFAALSFAVPSALSAAEIEIEADGPVIELSIYEAVTVEPDLVTIGAGVSTDAPTAVEALRQNSIEMQRVIDRIKTLGVAEEDIQTTGIILQPKYEFDSNTRRSEFRGYSVYNLVSVKLREVSETGRILDSLVDAGATDISGPRFSVEDDAAAKEAARERAVERGQGQAEAYAEMLGYEEVRVLEISESIMGTSPTTMESGHALRSPMAAAVAPVQPGLVSTGLSLTIKYEVVDAEEDGDSEEDGEE